MINQEHLIIFVCDRCGGEWKWKDTWRQIGNPNTKKQNHMFPTPTMPPQWHCWIDKHFCSPCSEVVSQFFEEAEEKALIKETNENAVTDEKINS